MFEVTPEDLTKIDEWVKKIWAEHLKEHPEAADPDMPEYPKMGAIGGVLSYSFTPTSLGVVFKVRDFVTGKELDLTDYDSW